MNSPTNTDVPHKKSIDEIYEEIQDLYLEDNRPWIIGFSGGKDSTTVLQLVGMHY